MNNRNEVQTLTIQLNTFHSGVYHRRRLVKRRRWCSDEFVMLCVGLRVCVWVDCRQTHDEKSYD